MYRDANSFSNGESLVVFDRNKKPQYSTAVPRRRWLIPRQNDIRVLLTAAYALTIFLDATDAIDRANLKLSAPRVFGWLWRRRRQSEALRVMCTAIDALNDTVFNDDRRRLIEQWHDRSTYRECEIGFEIAISIA